LDTDVPEITPEIKEWLNTVKLTVQSYRYEENSQASREVTGIGVSQHPFDNVIHSKRYVWGQISDFNSTYHVAPVTERAEYYLIVQQDSLQRSNERKIQKRCGMNATLKKMAPTEFP
jgi:hypothetical protein